MYEIGPLPYKKLRNTAFNWEASVVTEKNFLGRLMNDRSVWNEKTSTWLDFAFEIPTLHTWAYYGFFKPTIAEVLAQIPAHFFKHISEPLYFVTNVLTAEGDNITLINNDYHIARTLFFKKK